MHFYELFMLIFVVFSSFWKPLSLILFFSQSLYLCWRYRWVTFIWIIIIFISFFVTGFSLAIFQRSFVFYWFWIFFISVFSWVNCSLFLEMNAMRHKCFYWHWIECELWAILRLTMHNAGVCHKVRLSILVLELLIIGKWSQFYCTYHVDAVSVCVFCVIAAKRIPPRSDSTNPTDYMPREAHTDAQARRILHKEQGTKRLGGPSHDKNTKAYRHLGSLLGTVLSCQCTFVTHLQFIMSNHINYFPTIFSLLVCFAL